MTIQLEGISRASARTNGTLSVDRAANAARVNAIAVMFSAALSVGVSVALASGLWWGIGSAVATIVTVAALFAAVYRVPPIRRAVTEATHRITGE
jgi:hypothetical protein